MIFTQNLHEIYPTFTQHLYDINIQFNLDLHLNYTTFSQL